MSFEANEELQRVDGLQNMLADSVFNYAKAKKKAAGGH